ncbi:tripartite tricarboxylate transporter permease [Spiribacter halobius]|uniref:C4-dicarboxylate ABC transporter permease n=1 Tax=Sediminicurvatus halobius TaxID=2182432 RepID=A0A2U2N958_9GAMM|nr:tripartite tricarboxylate transporter permease [Spiribacter halobius]PWG65544.1 C4-dicarboxylate ABC transporter permease [Spiribacter halobius]UEX76570.1 tripartite tricarboxylate transporter permease [Spiribacter halobius]
MLNDLGAGFLLFAEPASLIALVSGVLIGVAIGAIPGMSTVMAVAVVLPFTFTMPPVAAILLLLGVYKGGMYGGSISAVLINTPGTPAASCTLLDGNPLARQGKARIALQTALYASVVGDLISNLVLILLAAWLAKFALQFGAPELFTLVVFSLTIVSGVAGENLLKGVIAAALGLLLATVGTDLIVGTPRFAFDVTPLRGGVSLVPVLIGLFALPEVLRIFQGSATGKMAVAALGDARLSVSEFLKHWQTVLRGSALGVVLGVIPGLGATPAAFLSYSEARRRSPDPDSFGKGNIDGVAAAESGNSSVGGATMIPLLALGIPGDVITAVILGAFMIHGLQPGPLLFQNNIDIIYSLFIGLLAGSALLLLVGRLAIPILGRIVSMRSSLLMPGILVLCVYGAYAVNNSIFDVMIMGIMGPLAMLMIYSGLPRAPFLIAFVLGPLLEDNFRKGLLMGQGDFGIFFSSPITWLFWGLTLLSVAGAILSHVRRWSAS